MDKSTEIINRLEEENRILKKRLLQYEAGKITNEKENVLALKPEPDVPFADQISEDDDIRLIDVIPLEQLQILQDKFSIANGVASVIVGTNGKPVTKPSNIRDFCISPFHQGKKCIQEDRIIHGSNTVYHQCRLSEAGTPIYIGGKHVADWKIGMCGFGGIVGPFLEAVCENVEKYDNIHEKLSDKLTHHFESVCSLLKATTEEISAVGYLNIRLTCELIKRKEHELRIAESENTFHSIFDNSIDGLMLIGEDGNIRDWNRGAENMSGFPKEQVIGKNLWDVTNMTLPQDRYSKEEIEGMRVRLNEIITRKEQTTLIWKIVNQKTQQERTIHALYITVHRSEVTDICIICRDITENVNREQELLVEKERLETLGNNYPDGCLFRAIMDLGTKELKFTYLSKTYENVFGGVSIDVALSDINNVFSLIFPEDLSVLKNAVMKSAETMTNMNIELRFHHKNASLKWAHLASHPHLEGNSVVWDGFILDITERKNTELKLEAYRTRLERMVKERTEELEATNEEMYATNEELYATNEEFAATNEELNVKNHQLQQEIAARQEVMKKLEESENKMRSFIEQSFEGIVIIDHEGKVAEWNPAQERFTKISREEAIGQYAWEIFQRLVPKGNTTKSITHFHELILTLLDPASEQTLFEELDHVIQTSDDEERYCDITFFQIAQADKYYVGQIVRDITERKLLDIELELYRTQLEEMVALQTRELIENKERLTSLSDNLPGGAIYQMVVKEGLVPQFTYMSANFTNMFHIAVDDVMEDSSLFFRMLHPKDETKLVDLLNSPNQLGLMDVECQVNLDTNETKWVNMRLSYHIQGDTTHVWDGFIIDITDRKNAERELEETRRRQNILIRVLQIVQSAENMSEAINAVLSEIGKYAEVSRTYIFEKSADGKTVDNTYEWCNEGIMPEIGNLQGVPVEFVSDWFDAFDKDEYICASDIKELSPAAYGQLSLQGIKSIVVLPLEANGFNYGFVGFDECWEYKQWQKKEVELLISLSQIISSTTRRFRAEKSIQLSQQTMRTVLDNINASIYVADFDTYEVLFANKMIKDQIGEGVEGEICWKVLQKGMTGPCDFCPNSKLLDDNKQPTGLYRWEVQNRVLGKYFECTDAAIEWIDGRLVHMEYATDITDRRAAEKALRQSEELYRQLTVASPDAIVVCNPRGRIVFISPKAKDLFMVSDDLNIRKMKVAHFVHPHDAQKAYELFMSLAEDKISFLPQLLLMREDGSDFFGEISAACVKNDNERTTSIIMGIRDITERKMNEMELIRAKEKAEESDKLKSAFLANMSHEISTPINGIIGFLNFLADDNLSPKRRQEYITVVNNSSVQLVKLIDDIIDIAKIEAKQMSIKSVSFHLNDFMGELQVFFDTYLQANHQDKIALILEDSQFIDPGIIFADPIRLRQILTNLIGNSIKFTEKGFIGFGYRLFSPDKLEFWVEDSGVGLPPDQLEVIFERFRQAELNNTRKYGGTGLGLTISRSLAQMMGGDITVESVEGAGSTFRFTISYLPVDSEDEPLFKENAEENPIADQFKGMAILIVEPDLMRFRYYEKLLTSTGATLIHAPSVKQWLDTVNQQKHIDVVLAAACVFQNADDEAFLQVRSVRAGLPLVMIITEHNEYYDRIVADNRCNKVIEGLPTYKILYDVLKKYV